MKKFVFTLSQLLVMVSASYVFASSRMVGNAEVAPVDTVAPDAPSDTVIAVKGSSRAYVQIFFLEKSIKVSLFTKVSQVNKYQLACL